MFQNYYAKLPQFQGNPYIPVVGTLASGIPYLGGPLITLLVRRFQRYRILIVWVGYVICILGLFLGSFADSIGTLILTQGILYGSKKVHRSGMIGPVLICKIAGFVTFYFPVLSIVNEWWISRRGFAFGIITSAAGASGIAMPLVIEALLNRYGFRTSLRAIATAMVILTGPLIFLIKPRLPISQSSTTARTDWSFARNPLLLVYCTANMAQGLGFFFPSLFLPSYATSVGLSPTKGATLLSIMAAAQVLGQWTFGVRSDKFALNPLVLLSTMVAAIACFAAWGLSHSLWTLVIFSILFGFFAYGFSSMRARMGIAVAGEDPTVALQTFGMFTLCQGIGNVLAGPISAGLLKDAVRRDRYGILRYKALIIFTGASMVLSALSVGFWYVRPRRLRT